MTRLLLGLLLIALPLCELALLIRTGQAIGFWATLGLVAGAALAGAAVMSRQGLTVARKTQAAIALGLSPAGPALDGAFLLLAGGLLVMPGFITDGLALLLLIPPMRRAVARWCVRRLAESVHLELKAHEARRQGNTHEAQPNVAGGPIIEGEFERLSEKAPAPHPSNGADRL
jgi:UPF0716 protein FxsA